MSTPVQRQYQQLKAENPDAILFFQLGDFFELFHEDAHIGAKILGIQLTARHRGTESEMAMCGFPMRAHEEYLQTLLAAGHKVAMAEQVIVDDKITRQVTRIVTPATVMSGSQVDENENRYVLAIFHGKREWALAYADVSTGEFKTAVFGTKVELLTETNKIAPREVLLPTSLYEQADFCAALPQSLITPQKPLKKDNATEMLQMHFGLSDLGVFGLQAVSASLEASGMVLRYLQTTQKTDLGHIQKLTPYSPEGGLQMDETTLRHLELFQSLRAEDQPATLWGILTKPKTPMGSRRLRGWLLRPLTDKTKLQARHRAVASLVENRSAQTALLDALKPIGDLERLMSKLTTNRANARDMRRLGDSLTMLPAVHAAVQNIEENELTQRTNGFAPLLTIAEQISTTLAERPEMEITQGGIIEDGVNAQLDALRTLTRDGTAWLNEYVEQQKAASGISTVRVKHSKTFGYTLEISKANAPQAPAYWVRRQTLVNAERYTTAELSDYEGRASTAVADAAALEYELFQQLRNDVLQHAPALFQAAQQLSIIDAYWALSEAAITNKWTRPTIIDGPPTLKATGVRHPVVEALSTHTFIKNSLLMNGERSRLHLITGPNMAGKSTYLRQNALLIVLAQAGSFVPADACEMTLFDRIFTRVGASDHLAGGKSTFYVEMHETARILRNATERSFIILDEIGRGTSTFDGLSLAWAITDHLHTKTKAMTLFATHYHELVDLAHELPAANNFHVAVSVNDDSLTFLHQIRPGGIHDSFGIHVAEISGIPKSVTTAAKDVLRRLESESLLSGKPNLFSTFSPAENVTPASKESEVEIALRGTNIDEMTPRQAHQMLYDLQSRLPEGA